MPNIKRTAAALEAFMAEKNISMLVNYRILNRNEIESRYLTRLEQYMMTLEIEAETFLELAQTRILPAAFEYQHQLAGSIRDVLAIQPVVKVSVPQVEIGLINQLHESIARLTEETRVLKDLLAKAHKIINLPERAHFFADHIADQIETARQPADELEMLIADDLWPLPKYSEILFNI